MDLSKFESHLAKATETNNAHVEASFGSSEALERSKHCDPGTENGTGQLQGIGLVDLCHEPSVSGELPAEATVSVLSVVGLNSSVLDLATSGAGITFLANVLLVMDASIAGQARVDIVADSNVVTDLKNFTICLSLKGYFDKRHI